MDYVHLRATSCYSFLRGAGHPERYLEQAAALGQTALALTEEDYLCALPRFEMAAGKVGVKPIVGGTLTTEIGPLTFVCRRREGYRRLCQLTSRVHLAGARGAPLARWADLEAWAGEGSFVLTGGRRGELARRLRARDEAGAEQLLRRLCELYGARSVLVEIQRLGCAGDRRLSLQQVELARRLGLRYVATGDVRYAVREDFPVYDLLTCTRYLQTVDTPFAGRPANDMQYLQSGDEMARTFEDLPEALRLTTKVAEACDELGLSRDRYVPSFNGAPEAEQHALLTRLVHEGVKTRYPRGMWAKVAPRVADELRIIHKLGLDGYFLLVWDVCRWARAHDIRCAGRGSAAGSVVCYALRIANVDAYSRDITPARFLNEERTESLPDIDVDFARDGRDKVLDYILKRYGPGHVAMTGTYVRYHARSAVRDVGRALALPPAEIDALAKSLPHLGADQIDGAEAKYPDIRGSAWAESRFAQLRALLPKLAGIPRNLGTHLGGVVITSPPLADLVGVQHAARLWETEEGGWQPFPVIQGDKEDVEDRLTKFDCLCLPMFSVLEDANRFIRVGQPEFEVFDVPLDNEATYARLRRSETYGAFEVGSPAQRSLHARLGCDCFEPLVAALALIRPGPMVTGMPEHYLARRHGREKIEYWLPELEPVLSKTYGVLVYQEQVIEVARIAAGLTAAEADLLRRSISHYRSGDAMAELGRQFCAKAEANGLAAETAASLFDAVRGFAGYGFCESHAAAFADTAYRSVYLIEHHPAEYFAGLLRNQPMGFYPVHTLIGVVRRRGVRIESPDINHGPARTEGWGDTIRMGLAQIKRISVETAEQIVATRPHRTIGDLQRAAGLPRDKLMALVRSGACDHLQGPRGERLHRRMLLWQIQELPRLPQDDGLSLDLGHVDPPPDPRLADLSDWDKVAGEWDVLGYSPTCHPVELARRKVARYGAVPVARVPHSEPGTAYRVCGLVIRPHRPPTKTGRNTLFFDLEDESGVIPITCFRDVYQRDGQAALHNPVVMVAGRVDNRTGQGLIADKVVALRALPNFASPHARTLY
ncbi:MAG: DNA polymerase III subunit alpha [Armatimonadetes bacterium]|nr:DNA polymerase III subunit alpha [Armatimonadota bacterium]